MDRLDDALHGPRPDLDLVAVGPLKHLPVARVGEAEALLAGGAERAQLSCDPGTADGIGDRLVGARAERGGRIEDREHVLAAVVVVAARDDGDTPMETKAIRRGADGEQPPRQRHRQDR